MSRLLVHILRNAIGRQLRYECPTATASISFLRHLSVSTKFYTKSDEETPAKPEKKKTKEIPKITLIQQNDSMIVTTLEEANKLALRRNLKLIKVQDLDPKSLRPVYKLATVAELLAEDDINENKSEKSASSSSKKHSVKSLTIGSRISDNDLNSRLKNIGKWLSKGCEVRVLIQGGNDDGKGSETVFQKIEASIKEPQVIGKITQKRSKDSMIKFNIYPALGEKKDSSSSDKQKA
ncbi:translation initiation factor IF-3 [Eupeodes corollae]|uniref:translation initiation factor IF-3 n=1 Tax=Eupeodes corollae TaxID=290404 RepID=UPI0024924C03|nr:translation initiation factor IF-3 [Eupeodes corollae]